MNRVPTAVFSAVAALSVAGCATVRGAQDPVPELRPQTLITLDTAVRNYHLPSDDARDGMSRRDYRERVLTMYLSAIESRYKSFTDQLGASDRGSALVGDLVMLGLTGATALAGAGDVDDWATIAAIGGGARATIDKRLFFDRTLPAVISSMDAVRAVIKAEIARKRTLPAEQYSLDEAVDDMFRLQAAGRLDRAITRMTQVAEADRAAMEARLNSIQTACDGITRDTTLLNQEFRQLVRTGDADQSRRLSVAARQLDMNVPEGTTPEYGAVASQFDTALCDDDDKRQFLAALRASLEDTEGTDDGDD
jgi:hypothetical protein